MQLDPPPSVVKLTDNLQADSIWKRWFVSLVDYVVPNVAAVTGTAHAAGNETIINVNDTTAGADVTVTLPKASVSAGKIYHIKKIGNSYDVIVDANGSELIDDATTATLTIQYESIMIYCNGTSWSIH